MWLVQVHSGAIAYLTIMKKWTCIPYTVTLSMILVFFASIQKQSNICLWMLFHLDQTKLVLVLRSAWLVMMLVRN